MGSRWTNSVQFGLLGVVEGRYRPVFATRSTICTRNGPSTGCYRGMRCHRRAMWSGRPRAGTNGPSRCNSGLPGPFGAVAAPRFQRRECTACHPERSVTCRYRAYCGAADASCGRMSRQRAASGPNSVQFGLPGAVEGHYRPVFATRSTDCTRSRVLLGAWPSCVDIFCVFSVGPGTLEVESRGNGRVARARAGAQRTNICRFLALSG